MWGINNIFLGNGTDDSQDGIGARSIKILRVKRWSLFTILQSHKSAHEFSHHFLS